MVDNFGVKYTCQEDIDYLIKCIKEKYELTMDWDGNLYYGICLKWDYNVCTLDISMPGYILKQLQKYKHATPTKQQHCPYAPQSKQYGSKAQQPLPQDMSPLLSKDDIKQVQCVIGRILYYSRAVNLTVLMALSTIPSKQAYGTENAMLKMKQLLDYLATHPAATVRFHASGMVLNIHSDA
jgi:hypothetical protein